MKKSTGILILLTFFIVIIILIGLIVTLAVVVMKGSTPNFLGGKRVALVRIEGVLYDVEDWVDQIRDYGKDSSIAAIVTRVDSPGGAVTPSQELYDALRDVREKHNKIVVASFGSVAASGGYYAVCDADKIVSSQGTLTGSIGVYSKFLQAKELLEKIGLDYETIKAGKYKDFGSMERELEPYEREMMQGVIDDTYMQFIEAVVEGRKQSFEKLLLEKSIDEMNGYPFTEDVVDLIKRVQQKKDYYKTEHQSVQSESVDEATGALEIADVTMAEATQSATSAGEIQNATEIREKLKDIENLNFGVSEDTIVLYAKSIAQGKIYTGRQAHSIGLVDEIGTLEDAIKLAASLAGLEGEPTVVEKVKRELSWFDLLTKGLMALTDQGKVRSPLQYRFPY